MKKLILLLFMLSSGIAYSQNPIWSVAPDYMEMEMDINPIPQSLPTPIPPSGLSQADQDLYYYHGQSATTVSNAQADAQGNLLFFIVDNKIYDGEGYLIDAFAYLLIS